jgi:type II secretory ATPase GspE/PulE/Tfp pilus assembly ATPase PilB-like protein
VEPPRAEEAVLTRDADAPSAEIERFGLLVRQGLIREEDLAATCREARQGQVSVESLLVSRRRISKRAIGESLSAFYGCPFREFEEGIRPPPELVARIGRGHLKNNLWFPLGAEGDVVEILIDDPRCAWRLQDVQHVFPGARLRLYVGLRDDILRFLHVFRDGRGAPSAGAIGSILQQLKSEPRVEDAPSEERELECGDSAIIRLVNQIVVDAVKAEASDIHVEPNPHKDLFIRFRVDGECRIYQRVPRSYRRALVSRIKIMAGLDIAERRKPQDGKIAFRLPDRAIEIRVAVIPTFADDEDVVMRLQASSEVRPLEAIHLSPENLRRLRGLLERPHGIILCVGPTGSGKTTTLHSALATLNGPDRKIWTAEDPIEISQFGLRQVQVRPKIGLTFAAALRAFLRADPDVIMVGEMRDRETIETGIQASLTGHLVLSTLHTNSAVETVLRLLDMGVDPFNYADALLGVLAQRLLRTVCAGCREWREAPPEVYDRMARVCGEAALLRLGARRGELRLPRGKGCAACDYTGFRGRMGAHELLVSSDAVRKLIQGRAPAAELLAAGKAQGMSTLIQDGIAKCLQGHVAYDEVQALGAF